MKKYLQPLRISLVMTLALAVLLCGLYPLTVFVFAQACFPDQANGSIVLRQGMAVGAATLGQTFSGPQYGHPRPSAAGAGYDAANSGGSNLGPLSRKLVDSVAERVAKYRVENGLPPETLVPADAVTASGSGLDPHISVANALLQADRIARARDMDVAAVRKAIRKHTEGRSLGLFGEPGVNVLSLNLALDAQAPNRQAQP